MKFVAEQRKIHSSGVNVKTLFSGVQTGPRIASDPAELRRRKEFLHFIRRHRKSVRANTYVYIYLDACIM